MYKMTGLWKERNEYRVTCSCGWSEKASDETQAQRRFERHRKFPHR